MFGTEIDTQAQQHAIACYPEESVGIVVDRAYVPLSNKAQPPSKHVDDPRKCRCRLCAFAIGVGDLRKYDGRIEAVIHSHPGGPYYPSQTDMQSQIAMGVPWGLLVVDVPIADEFTEPRTSTVSWFGDQVPREPLIGRQFVHGITDCYAIIRDTFALGRDELRRLEITDEWPFEPIQLADVPRNDGWWVDGDDLYEEFYGSRGFVEVSPAEVQPGDVFLCRVPRVENGKLVRDALNHAGMYIGNHLILDHQPGRLSARQPLNIWARAAEKWIRYTGPGSNADDPSSRTP